jgi:serine/threonine protein kinase
MAPEVFADDLDDDSVACDFPVDVYSYGMLLYMLFSANSAPKYATGGQPRSPQQLLMRVGRGERFEKPAKVTPFYWDLIQRCWEHDRMKRPSFPEIISLLLKSHEYAFPGTNMMELEEYEARVTSLQDAPSIVEESLTTSLTVSHHKFK